MRQPLVAALVAAAAALPAAPATAACSLGQLGTNPWQCGPAVPDSERGKHVAYVCQTAPDGVLTAAAYVPYAIKVAVSCTRRDFTAAEEHEGPVGYVTPWRVPADDAPWCTAISWWYSDGTLGGAAYGVCF